MKGWIVNVHSVEYTRSEERDQLPVFYDHDGAAIFEVWIWHPLVQRWFVLSWTDDAELAAQGVVFFRPTDVPEVLRQKMAALERAAGLDPMAIPRFERWRWSS